MPPLVSVIILAYQEPAFLNGLLASLKEQTHTNIEILIVDDASGKEFTDQYHLPDNARLIVNTQRRALAAVSRNTAMRQARGQYLAFIDQDDRWHPEKLAIQVAALESHPDALLHYTHLQHVDSDLQPLPRQPRFRRLGVDPLCRLLYRNTIPYSSVMLRQCVLKDVGYFDEGIRGAADWDLWLSVAAAEGPEEKQTILADKRPLLLSRQHPRQWSRSGATIARGSLAVLDKASRWVPLERPDLRRLIARRRARWLRELGRCQLAEQPRESMTFLRQSAKICPLNIRTYVLMMQARRRLHAPAAPPEQTTRKN